MAGRETEREKDRKRKGEREREKSCCYFERTHTDKERKIEKQKERQMKRETDRTQCDIEEKQAEEIIETDKKGGIYSEFIGRKRQIQTHAHIARYQGK